MAISHRAASTTPRGASNLSESLGTLSARITSAEAIARAEAGARRQAEQEERSREAGLVAARNAFWAERGRRYRSCTLDNYRVETAEQAQVVARLRCYADELPHMLADGTGIMLLGPAGTGKDHLLAALCEVALAAGYSMRWTSGAKLWARFRDGIDSEQSEAGMVSEFVRPAVLVLSDPVPIAGDLTPYQRATLYQIIDGRYNDCKPIWASLNGSGRQDVERALGVPILDRMRHGAVSLACNWPSFRATERTTL